MRRTNNIIRGFFLVSAVILISFGCAQDGGGLLVGGPKDTKAPVVVESSPENFSTNFTGLHFEFVFDEYFALKDINNKLIISPPMEEKPEIKVKGKKLSIHFPKELQPDLTYTLNFGDALADLNENNAYDNFAVVFSTGDAIDSLEMEGTVVDAFTGEPVEGVSVMLYARAKSQDSIPPLVPPKTGGMEEDSINLQPATCNLQPETDSLPLTSLPLYVSRTDKQGKYHLNNLAGGEYKIFALLDGNNNYLYDQATEQIAFIDSLVAGHYIAKTEDEVPKTEEDADSIGVEVADSLVTEVTDSVMVELADSTLIEQATKDTTAQDLSPLDRGDTGGYVLELHLFTESLPKQQIRATERKQADKAMLIFNEPLDSVNMELLYADGMEDEYLFEPGFVGDSLTVWVTDSLLSSRDSLVFAVGYLGYDSLEQREWLQDTLKFKFRPTPPKAGDPNPFSLRSNTGRTMELGVPFTLTSGMPYESIDTSRISLFRVRDSLEFQEEFRLIEVEPKGSLAGIHQDKLSKRRAIIDKVFLQDSSYSLRVLPGAFTGWLGDTNDSLEVNFKVNNVEKYGSIIMKVENLHEPAVLQLLNNKGKPIVERNISGDSEEKFELLKPSKYKFKLILDKNNNGKWDTGRYLKNTQPEEVLFFSKEISLKANWEMEEIWKL